MNALYLYKVWMNSRNYGQYVCLVSLYTTCSPCLGMQASTQDTYTMHATYRKPRLLCENTSLHSYKQKPTTTQRRTTCLTHSLAPVQAVLKARLRQTDCSAKETTFRALRQQALDGAIGCYVSSYLAKARIGNSMLLLKNFRCLATHDFTGPKT